MAMKTPRNARQCFDTHCGTSSHVIYVADVGSPKRTGWARVPCDEHAVPCCGRRLAGLVERAAADLRAGRSVALGFEAPLFLPVADQFDDLTRRRVGEGAFSWSAGAGACVSAIALPTAAKVLQAIRTIAGEEVAFTLDAAQWPAHDGVDGRPRLHVFEGFVSGPSHARAVSACGSTDHEQDAATAALAFGRWCRNAIRPPSAVTTDQCVSTIGAAALWSGWSTDHAAVRAPVLVLKPDQLLGASATPCWM